MAITLSKEAAAKVISYSQEASEQLLSNINMMDNKVNTHFSGLQDPTFKRYLQLSEEMQGLLREISGKMDDISEYCKAVMRWIDSYNDI